MSDDNKVQDLAALNSLLQEFNKSQANTIKQLRTTMIILIVGFTIIIVSMVAGFFYYESQFEIVETTTTTMETEGENANINNVTNGNMYNDEAIHNDWKEK